MDVSFGGTQFSRHNGPGGGTGRGPQGGGGRSGSPQSQSESKSPLPPARGGAGPWPGAAGPPHTVPLPSLHPLSSLRHLLAFTSRLRRRQRCQAREQNDTDACPGCFFAEQTQATAFHLAKRTPKAMLCRAVAQPEPQPPPSSGPGGRPRRPRPVGRATHLARLCMVLGLHPQASHWPAGTSAEAVERRVTRSAQGRGSIT